MVTVAIEKAQKKTGILSGLEVKNGKYTIQIISTINEPFVNKRLKSLISLGLPAWKASKIVKGKQYFRLRIGRYPDSKTAKLAAKSYQKYYKEKPFITVAR